MMFGLVAKISSDLVEVRNANGKGAVSGLPGEAGLVGKGLMNPFERVRFDDPQNVGHGTLLVQRDQQMNVIRHTTGSDQGTFFSTQDAAEIFMEARLKTGRQGWDSVFRAEDDVTRETGEGLGHCATPVEQLPPLSGLEALDGTLVPGAYAPGY